MWTMRYPDRREQQPQIIVDFRDGADRRPRASPGRLLFNRDRGTQAIDRIHFGSLHLIEKLPGVRRQCLNVPALAFRIDRVERQRALAGTAQAGDDRKRVPRNLDTDVLQIVLARAMHRNVIQHEGSYSYCPVEHTDNPINESQTR